MNSLSYDTLLCKCSRLLLSFLFYQATIIDCTCCLLNLLKTNQEGNALFTPRVHHITLHFLCMLKGALNKENFINRWNRKEQGERWEKGEKVIVFLSFLSFMYCNWNQCFTIRLFPLVKSSAWGKQTCLCTHTHTINDWVVVESFGVVTTREAETTQHATVACLVKNIKPCSKHYCNVSFDHKQLDFSKL